MNQVESQGSVVALSPEEVVRHFIAAINAHDTKTLLGLVSPGHRFIDSLGNVVSGHEALEAAWRGYFHLVPNFNIDVESLFASGQTVAVFGFANGSISVAADNSPVSWRLPAAWRALVAGEFVGEWQIYTDSKPLYEILGKGSGDRPA